MGFPWYGEPTFHGVVLNTGMHVPLCRSREWGLESMTGRWAVWQNEWVFWRDRRLKKSDGKVLAVRSGDDLDGPRA